MVDEGSRTPAWDAWLYHLDRLRPEILRDPVAAAMVHLAELVFTELRSANVQVHEQAREALARADARGEGAVFIVPGEKHLAAAMESLRSDARDGDRIRCSDTLAEYVRLGGMWQRA